MGGKDKEFLSFINNNKKKNESRHLIFWSLETLIGIVV
jgi:hypothetical protein